jgi:hypothetical protein
MYGHMNVKKSASYFKVVSYHLPALRDETHKNLWQDY